MFDAVSELNFIFILDELERICWKKTILKNDITDEEYFQNGIMEMKKEGNIFQWNFLVN